MAFDVEGTDEFANWFLQLDDDEQAAVEVRVELLEAEGPNLKRPVVGEIVGSKFDPQMKEIRVSVGAAALRILFIFDPRRTAVLLLGGDKSTGWKDWYRSAIPEADRLYEWYLEELKNEGLL